MSTNYNYIELENDATVAGSSVSGIVYFLTAIIINFHCTHTIRSCATANEPANGPDNSNGADASGTVVGLL